MAEEDDISANYGDISLQEQQSKTVCGIDDWCEVKDLKTSLEGEMIKIRGSLFKCMNTKKMLFLHIRQDGHTVQCVLNKDNVTDQMMKFVKSLNLESIVNVEGVVQSLPAPITSCTQQVEITVQKIHCLSRAQNLPFNLDHAGKSDKDPAFQNNKKAVARVNQDTRLNFRPLDLRTPANHKIFSIQDHVEKIFMKFLWSLDFKKINTPRLIAGSSEGGAAVFGLDYKGKAACLAQSTQLHKQMTINGGFRKIFEIGPVFRAEDSNTHRHLCQYTALDVEMEIMSHYSEVMDLVNELFVTIFDSLNQNCKKDLQVVDTQYPFKPLKYLKKAPRLTYDEGIMMLREDGMDIEPFADLSTAAERRLGQLIFEKHDTDFYMLHRFPLALRPFFTMPCHHDPRYSNSFDVYLRGEEIISGGQRIHDPELLVERLQACSIDVSTMSYFIDSFRYGAIMRGGFGAGLERVVMLFCGLDNIRKASLFPRDMHRLDP